MTRARSAPAPALSGVRVLEFSENPAGGLCGQLLGDLGADVVKVEPRRVGDPTRQGAVRLGEMSVAFAMANRNKRSVAIDLTRAGGREVAHRLLRRADVLLDSYRPGDLERLGLGYEEASRYAPGLVYCSLSGFGQEGPHAQRSGRDLNFVAVAGLIDQTGSAGGPPAALPVPVAEAGGALYAAVSILAALRARDASGQGQHLDVSLTDAAAALLAQQFGAGWAAGEAPLRGRGPSTGGRPGYGIYATRDGGHLAVTAEDDAVWRRLCELVGLPDLRRDAGWEYEAEAEAALAGAFAQRSRDEWVDLLADDEAGVTPVLRLDEVLRDPQLTHRGLFTSVAQRSGERLPQVGFPVRFQVTPIAAPRTPPALGADTRQILREAGLSEPELLSLERAHVVGPEEER